MWEKSAHIEGMEGRVRNAKRLFQFGIVNSFFFRCQVISKNIINIIENYSEKRGKGDLRARTRKASSAIPTNETARGANGEIRARRSHQGGKRAAWWTRFLLRRRRARH